MAAKKMDKDALKKNLFWIVLGVFTLVWIVAVPMALLSANAKARADQKASKSAVESAKSKGIKTPAYQEPWKAYGTKVRKHKDSIWALAWEQQKEMYTWPPSMDPANQPLYPDDPFARDASGQIDVTRDQGVRSSFREWYKEQFTDLKDVVGAAQFLGSQDEVFPPQEWDKTNTPTAEEIWLAQEDFWVRREMLYLIRQAMDAVALFRDVTPAKKEKLPEGIVSRQVFRNANWELTLLVEKAANGRSLIISDKSTIKNINVGERLQVLADPTTNKGGLPFSFQQGSATSYIYVTGEPVPFGQERELKLQNKSVSPVDLSKPFLIEQILAWPISPIRRIDLLAVAWHSHRTQVMGLKINPRAEETRPGQARGGGEARGGQGTGPGGVPGAGTKAPGAPAGGMTGAKPPLGGGKPEEAAEQAEFTSVNKIPRNRYLKVTSQCRQLPVAMRLIVDQEHIHDVLASMGNSRLRMQVTEVSFHHVRNVTPIAPAGDKPSGTGPATGPRPGKTGPGGAKLPPQGMMPGGPRGMGGAGGMRMPSMPGSGKFGGSGRRLVAPPSGQGGNSSGAPAKGTGGVIVDNARLVELTIYGIAALYERFPPRPSTTAPVAPGAGKTSPTR